MEAGGAKETSRIEAFSDGVFAIAITLLVLELRVPEKADDLHLPSALLALWPSYAGFTISFLTILIMWMNHHRMFKLLRGTDERLVCANGLLLLAVTFVPFPTGVLAEHLTGPAAAPSALFYSGTFVFISLCFNALWWTMRRRNGILMIELSPQEKRLISIQYACAPLLYMAAALLAHVNVSACIIANLLLALFFAVPGKVTQQAEAKP